MKAFAWGSHSKHLWVASAEDHQPRMFIPCCLAPRPCAISVITTTCWLYASAASFLVAGISCAAILLPCSVDCRGGVKLRSQQSPDTWLPVSILQHFSQPPETQLPGRVLGLLPVIANLKPSSHINKENRSSFRAGSLPLHRFSCQPHHHLLDLSPSFLPALDDPSSPHMSSMKLSLASTWPCTECFRMMLRSFSRSCSCSHFPFSWRLDCLCPLWFFPFYIFCSL